MSWDDPADRRGRRPRRTSQAVADCLRSGWLTMGPRTKAFEEAVAELHRRARTPSPSPAARRRCTSPARRRARPRRRGDRPRVHVPGHRATRRATCGATPVLCDVVSPARARTSTPPTSSAGSRRARKAVIAVHMLRLPGRHRGAARAVRRARARADRGRRAGASAASTTTAPAGTSATSRCLSLLLQEAARASARAGWCSPPTRSSPTRVRLLRSHAMTVGTWDRHRGHEDSYDVVDIGFNFRLDEPRAALGLSPPAAAARRDRAPPRDRPRLPRAPRRRALMCDDVRSSAAALRLRRSCSTTSRRASASASALAAARIQTTRYPALHALTEFARYATRPPERRGRPPTATSRSRSPPTRRSSRWSWWSTQCAAAVNDSPDQLPVARERSSAVAVEVGEQAADVEPSRPVGTEHHRVAAPAPAIRGIDQACLTGLRAM